MFWESNTMHFLMGNYTSIDSIVTLKWCLLRPRRRMHWPDSPHAERFQRQMPVKQIAPKFPTYRRPPGTDEMLAAPDPKSHQLLSCQLLLPNFGCHISEHQVRRLHAVSHTSDSWIFLLPRAPMPANRIPCSRPFCTANEKPSWGTAFLSAKNIAVCVFFPIFWLTSNCLEVAW